jgi:hypothetical protein
MAAVISRLRIGRSESHEQEGAQDGDEGMSHNIWCDGEVA